MGLTREARVESGRGGAAGKEGMEDIEKPPRVVNQLEGNPKRAHKAACWAQGS